MEAEALLDTHFPIVKDEPLGNAVKMLEYPLVGFRKALCILIQASFIFVSIMPP